jgi:hypothetical protein
MEEIKFFQERGQTGQANVHQHQLDDVNSRLADAIVLAREYYAALAGDPTKMANLNLTADQIQNIIVKLDTAKATAENFGYTLGISNLELAQKFSQGGASALDRFAHAIVDGGNAFRSLGDAFRQFAADFLSQIAQMIEQQVIFNLVSGFVKSIGSAGLGSSGTDAVYGGNLGGIYHDGGVVGTGGKTRPVSPAWFANAERFHRGGIPGLMADEIPAILQKGEEVLTRGDPRHILNGGGRRSTPNVDVKVVNAIDSASVVEEALNTRLGQKVVMNFMKANSRAIKTVLG